MYILQMHVECADRFFEILPEKAESAELMVEVMLSHVLLVLFDKVAIDEVTIYFPSHSPLGRQHCSIDIRVHCFRIALLTPTEEHMKQALELRFCPLLNELFGVVHIDNIKFIQSPWDNELDPILTQSA
jgi:hypothetical protein